MSAEARRLVVALLDVASPEAALEAGRDAVTRGGVGGLLLFRGDIRTTPPLVAELRRAAPHPLIIMSDLERGAGQQVAGLPDLPWAMAFGAADDADLTYRAGRLTAAGARAAGIDLVLAPVADVNSNPRNPIIDIRSFGDDPERVSRHVEAFVRGVRDGGAASCAKHFPGHGATEADSHAALPVIGDPLDVVRSRDLAPFRAAAAAGADAVMTAHVLVPARDPHRVASRSPRWHRLLREEIGFAGLVVTDALLMEGAGSEGDAAREALAAGADLLLAPRDPFAVAEALDAADPGRAREALARQDALLARVAARTPADPAGDPALADEVARRAVTLVRAEPGVLPVRDAPIVVLRVGAGGVLHDPPEDGDDPRPFGRPVRAIDGADLTAVREALAAGGAGPIVCEVVTAPRAWAEPPRLTPELAAVLDEAARARPLVLVSRGSPYVVGQVPGAAVALAAFGPDVAVRRAARRALAAGGPFPGKTPVRWNA